MNLAPWLAVWMIVSIPLGILIGKFIRGTTDDAAS